MKKKKKSNETESRSMDGSESIDFTCVIGNNREVTSISSDSTIYRIHLYKCYSKYIFMYLHSELYGCMQLCILNKFTQISNLSYKLQ